MCKFPFWCWSTSISNNCWRFCRCWCFSIDNICFKSELSIDGICFASNSTKVFVTPLFYSSTCNFSAIIFEFDIEWVFFPTIYINFFSIFIRVRNLYCWSLVLTRSIYNYSNFNLIWRFTLAINSFILNCVSTRGICINSLSCCVTIYWDNFSMNLIT